VTEDRLPDGPDREELTRLLSDTWRDAVVLTVEGGTFFSLDEKHFPNFATIVWSDDMDLGSDPPLPSRLSRPGVYRLNVGVSKETFQRLVGDAVDVDYAALDRVVPHPVYAKQHWVSFVNPSHATIRDLALPLLTEAHDRLAAARARGRPADEDR
jgi:hypothetical protein